MVVRIMGGLLGAGMLFLTGGMLLGNLPFEAGVFFPCSVMGIAFVGYAIGGQEFLERFFPKYAEKNR